ncbi:MAG: molybdopterin-binding protein [Longimicrobiales bacterium]
MISFLKNRHRFRARITSFVVLVVAALAPSLVVAQQRVPCPVAEPGALVLYGDIPEPITLSAAELAALPQVTVTGTAHDGAATTYAGPTVGSILARADLPGGAALRGPEMLRYVVVEAVDGYRALFALAEFDSMYNPQVPILTLQQSDGPLDEDAGLFQIIAPDEERHARWVRQVACLRIARHQ